MENTFYEDSDYCEKMVDKAINNAIANLAMEGFVVTKEEKENLKKEFLDNYKIRILIKKAKANKNNRIVLLFLLKKNLTKDINTIGKNAKKPSIPKPATCSSVPILISYKLTLVPISRGIFNKLNIGV